jgi:hypothetical protein
MGQMQENKTKIVSKAIVAIIALSMVLPVSILLVEAKPTSTPIELSAPIVDTFYKQNDIVRLANAQFDVKVGPQNLASELVIDKYDAKVSGYYLVKFNDAINEYWIASLKAMGAKIGSYVPYNTYLVKMNAETQVQVQNLPYVRSVSIYQPAFRMQSSLLQGVTLQPGMQSADALSYISWNNLYQQASIMGLKKDITAVTVMLQQGENPYDLAALILKAGGKVLGITENSVRAEISKQGIQALAFVNNVEYIMPYFMPEIMNAEAAWTEQSKVSASTPVWTMGIHGDGVTVGIADTGLDTDHDLFRQNLYTPYAWTGSSPTHRKVVGYHQLGDNAIDYDGHGTHVTGTAVGNGAYVGSVNVNRYGMAYDAKVSFCDIGRTDTGATNDNTLGGIPQDLKTMYALQKGDGASLASNSWGVSVAYDSNADTIDDARTFSEGTYSEDSLNSDWYSWLNKEFQVFFSNGNDRGTPVYDGGPYNSTTTPPATGKNLVSVGAHETGANWATAMTFSSWGPTLDGRLKPDVSSTGIEDSAAAVANRDGTASTGYVSMSGTSMASPAAVGGGALVSQYYRDGWYPTGAAVVSNGFVPSNALIKATLINGARDTSTSLYPYTLNGHTMNYPNGDAGWGAIDTGDSLYFAGDAREIWMDDNKAGLITGQMREYKVSVATGTPLEITLVWTDFPGTVATWGALVNDLDLTVIGPTGTVYYGNNFGATSRQADSTNPAGYDHTNPVECVLLSTPGAGTYTIRVNAITVPKGPQPFALVAAANFDAGYGWVKTDKMVYKPGDTMTVEVQDTNVGTTGAIDTVTVQLTSSTGDIETRTLTETAVASYRFTGTTVINALTPVNGNGAISIENNGGITVKYTDVNPAHDSYANVSTLMDSPKISNVYVTDISNTAAIVHWTTDVPATSQVFYGTTVALGSTTTLDGDMVLVHDVAITTLTAFTNYYFDVQSVSIGGVTTRDTNGGSHYMFTTVDNPDVLIIQEHSDLSSSDQQVDDWRLSLNYYGWSFTVWETIKYGLPTLAAMNSAKMVYWDVGEGYPQLGSSERALVQSYLDQTGVQLFYVTGQDIGWDMNTGGTDVNAAWYLAYMRATFRRDDADGGAGTEGVRFQILATTHAISTGFGNQDLEQDIYGTGRFWPDEITNNQGGMVPAPWGYTRYAAGLGDCGAIAYNGASFKLAYEPFAHAMIQDDGTYGTTGNIFGTNLNLDRATIADRTIIWLMGGDHPDVSLTTPNGGQNWAGTQTITWTVANAASQSVQISKDGGQSYVVEATGLAGTATTYSWNTAKQTVPGIPDYPNGVNYKVKILAQGTTLKGFDISDAVFTVNNGVAGDKLGPVIVAGSIKVDPLPVGQGNTITITAQADDRAKGNSNIAQAEYFIDTTGANDAGVDFLPTDGTFNFQLEDITGNYIANIAMGAHIVYVHARDAAGNWGGFEQFSFQVNEGGPSVTVTAPNTAETIISGTYTITWTAADYTDLPGTLDCTIEYSANGGTSWTVLESALNNNDGSYTWNTLAVADGVNYLVRVTATDSFPLSGQDVSNFVFSIDNVVNDRWYLQVETTSGCNDLNMMPVDVGPYSNSSVVMSSTALYKIGQWKTTQTFTSQNIGGAWTFNMYGSAAGGAGSTGYLFAVVKAYPSGAILDTSIPDDVNLFTYTTPNLFTWTDTLLGTAIPNGERVLVEIWVSSTIAGSVLKVYDYNGVTAAGGPHNAWTNTAVSSPPTQANMNAVGTEFTDAQYTPMSTLDATRNTIARGGVGTFTWNKFEINGITEAPASMTNIELSYTAQYSVACTGQMWVYNFGTATWVTLGGTTAFAQLVDSTMTNSITTGFANYVSGGTLRYGIAGNARAITYIDYTRATVSTPQQVVATVYYDYPAAQSNVQPTIVGGAPPGVVYSIPLTGKVANSWVFVSFPSATSGAINTILNDATLGDGLTTWTVAKWFNAQDKADPWKTYRVGSTVNDMPTLTSSMGVWLWLTANGGDFKLTLNSYVANATTNVLINLYTGWNMVGYPSATARLGTATLPVQADYVSVWQAASPYVSDLAPGAVTMTPGNAYWVRVTADCTWTVVNP